MGRLRVASERSPRSRLPCALVRPRAPCTTTCRKPAPLPPCPTLRSRNFTHFAYMLGSLQPSSSQRLGSALAAVALGSSDSLPKT